MSMLQRQTELSTVAEMEHLRVLVQEFAIQVSCHLEESMRLHTSLLLDARREVREIRRECVTFCLHVFAKSLLFILVVIQICDFGQQ